MFLINIELKVFSFLCALKVIMQGIINIRIIYIMLNKIRESIKFRERCGRSGRPTKCLIFSN